LGRLGRYSVISHGGWRLTRQKGPVAKLPEPGKGVLFLVDAFFYTIDVALLANCYFRQISFKSLIQLVLM
jgi:hypothetical protein